MCVSCIYVRMYTSKIEWIKFHGVFKKEKYFEQASGGYKINGTRYFGQEDIMFGSRKHNRRRNEKKISEQSEEARKEESDGAAF